jgi:hypothetical protein
MPLEPLVLDDLDWKQLTDAARLRLPALSDGKWTLHAPVDPGVTLVEVLAWLLDQRVYWMDQVGEPLFRAAVELLGEVMRPVRAARTAMALERSGPMTHIASGTTLELARAASGPVFATVEGIELLDVKRIGLFAGGGSGNPAVDRENDLREERGVTLFSPGGSEGEAKIVLYLAAPPAPGARPFSLFLDVQAPPRILPEWHPDATDVPPPAEITWWYSRGPALPAKRFPETGVVDGTLGLRRAGVVRLPTPPDWAAEGPAVGALLPFAIFARTPAATFTFPASVRRIVPNAAIAAHHRVLRERRRVTDWLPLPGLEITLGESDSPPIPEEVRLRIREVDGHWHRWRTAPDFARSGPADRVFRVDRTHRRVEFGDGLTGRIPRPDPGVPASQSNVMLTVAVGAGSSGNVGADLAWSGDVAADVRATSLSGAVGGLEAESVDQARVRISGLLDRVERAVTPADHVTLAEATPGVEISRAHAAVGFHPGYPCSPVPGSVTVFVVPYAPRGASIDPDERVGAPMPDPGALSAVRAHLEQARMVGTEVWVCPPRYRTVRLGVRVLGDPVDPAAARLRIDAALRRFLDPLEGGDDGTGWPFGNPIRPSVLMRETVPVVEDGEVEAVAVGLDGEDPSQDCEQVPIGPHDLPALADVAVRFEPDRRSRAGGLR